MLIVKFLSIPMLISIIAAFDNDGYENKNVYVNEYRKSG